MQMSKSWKTLFTAVVMLGGVSSGAIADGYEYDYEPVGKGFAPPPVFSWTGTYAGVTAGWIRSESDAKLTGLTGFDFANQPVPGAFFDAVQPRRFGYDGNGFLAGLTLGYNQKFSSSFVAGIESDIAWTNTDASQTSAIVANVLAADVTAPTTLSTELQWFGTLRARAGVLATPQLLLYATGGLAYANIEVRGSEKFGGLGPPATVFPYASGSSSDWKAGWTVGGGGEWLLGRQTTIKAEYLYYDLNDSSVALVGPTGGTATYNVENKGHIVRMGLNVQLY
jgi:outer membrane immunogenic protein